MKLSQLYLSGTEISCFSMSKTPLYLEQLIRIARGKLNAEKEKRKKSKLMNYPPANGSCLGVGKDPGPRKSGP